MGTVVFLSHPLGDPEDVEQWHDNLASMALWTRFILDTTPYVVQAPAYLYAVAKGDMMSAGRRLVDSLTALERSDLLFLVGGHISPHMRDYDARTARRIGIPIVDLTGFGTVPPDKHDEDAVQLIMSRARKATTGKPRNVWMPRLTEDDIDKLKLARHALYMHVPATPGEYDVAVALLDRIIEAATNRGEK